jgi:Mg-chelatase subunit ChlD
MLLGAAYLQGYAASADKDDEVKLILQSMEEDVLRFRDEIERAYGSRCESDTLNQCARNNYNDCSSVYPNQECMSGEDGLVISACGDGTRCNGLRDKTTTAVRIPGNLAQSRDQRLPESVCYSRLAEPYMVANYNNRNQMYFGASTGAFRIIPARHSEVCGQYDPRLRPWFVAASSGPKDVVLVIDVSGSMEDYGRMTLAKDAAKTIVDTLTVADRVAIVTFSDTASQVGGYTSLIRATRDNKDRLLAAIDSLEPPTGATNFYDAFDTAFDAVDKTISQEATTGCNVAVLFLTDGQITAGPGADDVINLVNERTAKLATERSRKTTVFTFSLGNLADHTVTKSIACNTGMCGVVSMERSGMVKLASSALTILVHLN